MSNFFTLAIFKQIHIFVSTKLGFCETSQLLTHCNQFTSLNTTPIIRSLPIHAFTAQATIMLVMIVNHCKSLYIIKHVNPRI